MQAVAHPLPLSFPKSPVHLQLVANSAVDVRAVSALPDPWNEAYRRYQDEILHDELAAGEGGDWLQDMT